MKQTGWNRPLIAKGVARWLDVLWIFPSHRTLHRVVRLVSISDSINSGKRDGYKLLI